jgi:hypothetical protein
VRFSFRESVLPDHKNATKKVGPSVSVVKPLANRSGPPPKNAAPVKPSTDRKNLGLNGPQRTPAGGSD